jgi:multidrug efflux pump subunit AcrB
MVQNKVTPILLMFFLLVAGLYAAANIRQEVFPEFEMDLVEVTVAYPGASPEEVEQGIVLAIEEAARAVEGVAEIKATASPGLARVQMELLAGTNNQKALQDIKQVVDRITTFPLEAERPQSSLGTRRRQVLTIQLFGNANEWVLRNLAEEVRDRLLQNSGITQVELVGARDHEVHIEIPAKKLRAYNLSLDQVAQKIRINAIELPGGSVKTRGGEILIRFKERRDWADEFARLPIITTSAGVTLHLDDIAQVKEGFEDTYRIASYNGMPAVALEVFRVGTETPIGVSASVREAMKNIEAHLPPGINYDISRDASETYRQRLELLLKNGLIGFTLVLILLVMFLELKLAFWVTMIIPVSFLGTILFMPWLNVSINMISMFAFIVALGVVVDSGIVVGENIYEYRTRGMSQMAAAIEGASRVASPVAFSILTNIVAFVPLYYVPGTIGKTWQVIPLVVISSFIISWIVAVWIIPACLGNARSKLPANSVAPAGSGPGLMTRAYSSFIRRFYRPFLHWCLRERYLTLTVALALCMAVWGYVASGRIGVSLMPRIEADQSVARAMLPIGSPASRAVEVRDHLMAAARQVVEQNGGDRLVRGIFALINDNRVDIFLYLTDVDKRPISTSLLTRKWREQSGPIPGLDSLQFAADWGGPGAGAALSIELSHRDVTVLDQAAASLAKRMEEFPNLKEVGIGRNRGKQQLDFQLKLEGRSLGLTSQEVARQVRNSFLGVEVLRQQRGRNEIKVVARLTDEERISEYHIEQFLVTTPAGQSVPLMQVAEVKRDRAYSIINRRDGRRTIMVTADVEPLGQTGRVIASLNAGALPQLALDFPGLTYEYRGRQAELRDSMQTLLWGFVLALAGIYLLLAIPFRSYSQPVIVMISIPLGLVGAVFGHMIMDYDLSIMSMMGAVALAGVVVNGSLLLIDYANERRHAGAPAGEAALEAGIRRLRPILLTTISTFVGLAPMIFETSRQARFMIPMALSLGYGILFASLVSLIIVPCLYMVMEDLQAMKKRLRADT